MEIKTARPAKNSANEPANAAAQAKAGAGAKLTGRERFLQACQCLPLDRPPIWLMRQAGRALPEYRVLKEKYSFLQLVQTPELATEVTLQPIRRFGMDAAILFSDILVVAEALGQAYRFGEKGGIEMEFTLRSTEEIQRLDPSAVTSRLQYVSKALAGIRAELGAQTALLGFAGAPWTLANFMLEGGSAREFTRAKTLFYSDPKLFASLFEKLTAAVTSSLQLQIDAGVDAVQIFDSLGGILAENIYEAASGQWIKRVIAGLKGNTPVIVFGRGVHGNWDVLLDTGAQVLSVDWTLSLAELRARLPKQVALQGNLDPFLLTTTPAAVRAEAKRLLEDMRGQRGHIFNLGHGVPPDAKLDCIETLVDTVQSFK
jgi:uroporphyrinogen decarboxylase